MTIGGNDYMKDPMINYKGSKFKRLCVENLLLIGILFISLLMISSTVVQASDLTVKRLSGNDRYSTSIAISKEGWSKSDYAILTSGENYPDALSAAPLLRYAYPTPERLILFCYKIVGVWPAILKNRVIIGL